MSREKEALASICAAVTCAQLRRVAAAATVKFRKSNRRTNNVLMLLFASDFLRKQPIAGYLTPGAAANDLFLINSMYV